MGNDDLKQMKLFTGNKQSAFDDKIFMNHILVKIRAK